jgi:hypothetical protein
MTPCVSKPVGALLLAVALTVCCGGGTEPPAASSAPAAPAPATLKPPPPPLPGEAPDVWAKRVSTAYDRRKLLPKMTARSTKGVADAMTAWRPALKKPLGKAADGSDLALELLMVVQRVDDIWKNDVLDRERTNTIARRMASVPPAEVTKWRKGLAAVQKDEISDLWTVVLVCQTDALFAGPDGTLDPSASARLLDRLKVVPPAAVKDLAAVVDTAKADVALRVVENDRFFDGAVVRGAELEQGVASLKALRQATAK